MKMFWPLGVWEAHGMWYRMESGGAYIKQFYLISNNQFRKKVFFYQVRLKQQRLVSVTMIMNASGFLKRETLCVYRNRKHKRYILNCKMRSVTIYLQNKRTYRRIYPWTDQILNQKVIPSMKNLQDWYNDARLYVHAYHY